MPEVVPVLLVITAVIAWSNARYLKLPSTIGVMIGNRGRRKAMSDLTPEQLDQFCELPDSMLNAVLFVLIGFAWQALTWGGLRGGIWVALALSLPAGPERNALVTITCIVVVLSVLVQGLSVEKLVRKVLPCTGQADNRQGISHV